MQAPSCLPSIRPTKGALWQGDHDSDDDDDDDDDSDDGDDEGDNDDDDDDDDDNDGAATKVSQAFPRLHNSAAALSMIAASSAQKYVYKYS